MMQGAIPYGDQKINYEVMTNGTLHTKIRIHVHPNARVEVEAPSDASPRQIKEAVLKRARWIADRLAEIEEAHQYALPREYISGETHFYLGRRYQLKVTETPGSTPFVELKAGLLRIVLPQANAEAVRYGLNLWYRERARIYLKKRLNDLVPVVPWVQQAPPIKLLVMRRQWGSCSPAGMINLNPWLIRAPRECIDYVLLHELCHLREHNHSAEFYGLLDQLLPRWRPVKLRLDRMAELLLAY